ncbi:unnamed protein product [Coregonus sp. 'balchen']|nr:unnamed protein product [Coregonus sp. 'balchen']
MSRLREKSSGVHFALAPILAWRGTRRPPSGQRQCWDAFVQALSSTAQRSPDSLMLFWSSPQLDPSQIRLIVYQDCERRGRNVLFDSSAKKRSAEEAPASGSRCSSDANMLGEMMFGSVAMSYKGSTLKIHQIRSPPQLMLSKVFTARTGSSVYGSLNTLQDSLEFIGQDPNALRPDQNTVANGLLGNIGLSQLCSPRRAFSEQGPLRLIKSASFFSGHSNPMDMPGRSLYDERDSGIARSASLSSLLITPFPSPGSSLTSSQASSYQRRWLRSQTTSLENGVFPRWSVEESFNMSDESGGPSLGVARKKKIAIGVIFLLSQDEEENSKFQDFFFSHFPLFESHMNKLKSAIEQAMKMSRRSADACQRALAYSRMVDGLNEFRTTIVNLYTMPRVAEPVWLTMMSGAPEKNQLCGQFMRELSLLMEQASKNQLSDLYGAIGSPVRLSRTVVVGRRQELVQRLLYVLTYFIRCSELLETHMLDSAEDEAIVIPGSLITTSLRRGEVEESDYVLVTMHKPSGDYLSQGPEPREDSNYPSDSNNSLQSSTYTDSEAGNGPEEDEEGDSSNNSQGSKSSVLQASSHNTNTVPIIIHTEDVSEPTPLKESPTACVEAKLETLMRVGSASPREQACVRLETEPEAELEVKASQEEVTKEMPIKVFRSSGIPLEKKPPDKTIPVPVPGPFLSNHREEPATKYFSDDNPVETRTIDDVAKRLELSSGTDKTQKELLDPSGVQSSSSTKGQEGTGQVGVGVGVGVGEADVQTRCRCCSTDTSEAGSCRSCSAEQDKGIVISVTVRQGDNKENQQKKVAPLNDWEIPRNESSDSALGDSESEDTGQDIHRQSESDIYYREDQEPDEWQEEVEVPFPGSKLVENFSKPSIANFGRSLFGGYCPTNVPDFVLQGMPNDDKLRQGLMSELAHAVQHPVLDEPIAEAVCIIADTDKWMVQVASSQRRATDNNKLGKEVLVSSLVSSLLQSTHQLYKMNLSPNFCIMHLEDRLQEIYFKSKMLAEYLKGQTRVHSSDLPLLAAVASTHSPYVAQILL